MDNRSDDREERGGGGRFRGGRSGPQRSGRGGGRRGGGRGPGRGGRGGGDRGGRRSSRRSYPKQSAESGNRRERIAIESGALVFIDQFMLANPQFIDQFTKILDDGPEAKDQLIRRYGGCVVELEPGTYRIERDPFAYSIVIHPDGETVDCRSLAREDADQQGHVFVDTRCLAMIDRELLDDAGLLEKYQQLWFGGQDKACRDLIRDNGGAVRYGFQRYGDELGVYALKDQDVVCLWPDVIEEQATEAAISE